MDETVDYRFPSDMVASVPYVKAGKDGDYESQYFNSFENTYTTDRLSKLNKKRLMFLPLVVDAGEGVKICITESGLENYPVSIYLLLKGKTVDGSIRSLSQEDGAGRTQSTSDVGERA